MGDKTLDSENHKSTKSLNLICKIVLIMMVIFTLTFILFLYFPCQPPEMW